MSCFYPLLISGFHNEVGNQPRSKAIRVYLAPWMDWHWLVTRLSATTRGAGGITDLFLEVQPGARGEWA
jgi:hypothetical protein